MFIDNPVCKVNAVPCRTSKDNFLIDSTKPESTYI